MSEYERGFQDGYRESEHYVLVLNAYQRDNLLLMLNACGYPARQGESPIEPFHLLHTGPWMGEIAWMLKHEGTDAAFQLLAEKTGKPNRTLKELSDQVERDYPKLSG